MLFSKLAAAVSVACLAVQSLAAPPPARAPSWNDLITREDDKRALLQNIVTWDNYSLFVRGKRIMFYSGEFHPFRLPVPDLWLDVFQKIKGMGYSGVSFYVHWAMLEGRPGFFEATGVNAWAPFFEAASKAGIYLLARPGPYINAEVSGGGFPGWLQRVKGHPRTSDADYMAAAANYIDKISRIIAPYQITNGGPVILLQPENEYSMGNGKVVFPDKPYFQAVEDAYRKGGIVVPFMNNDAWTNSQNLPGSGQGEVDIYGHDSYPLGFDCANPYIWKDGGLPTYFWGSHMSMSPTTPYSIPEFQGGSFDPWGGQGFEKCSVLSNMEFERVFYKEMWASGVKIFNLYMTYGGTNWGNLGHPGGYTSYDYGSVVKEDRTIAREKYSEAKLEANFLRSSPTYLTTTPDWSPAGKFTNTADLTITPLYDRVGGKSAYYVVRHTAYNSLASTSYTLTVGTSAGTLTIPQTGGSLSLNGRDSKVHVVDYPVGGYNLLYSTAEIFTQKKFSAYTALVVYGGPGELHELAFTGLKSYTPKVVDGSSSVTFATKGSAQVVSYTTKLGQRSVVQLQNDFYVYLLNRNEAYNYWLSQDEHTFADDSSVIVKAGYLVRTSKVAAGIIDIVGDVNATTPIEVIGAPGASIRFNGQAIASTQTSYGTVKGTVGFASPKISLPDLSKLDWRYADSLPETRNNYDDSKWTTANLMSNNTQRPQVTPVSLYGSDYGYNTGNLLIRGHFTANGAENSVWLKTIGGTAYAMSAWLNETYLGSFPGSGSTGEHDDTFNFPNLKANTPYVLTVLLDNMGLDEDWVIGTDGNKNPRGILDYKLANHDSKAINWKITGNLGGENFLDHFRGPLNEGGLYAERQGWHLPMPPTSQWRHASPITNGVNHSGVGFFSATMDLNIPSGYDIPLSFVFPAIQAGATAGTYRCQLYVNGFQFGKYVNNVGPQTSFPVPPGVLNTKGTNYIALSLWAFDAKGAKLSSFVLTNDGVIQTGFPDVKYLNPPAYADRKGAY